MDIESVLEGKGVDFSPLTRQEAWQVEKQWLEGQKRPADVIGAAIKIARIAAGEIEEDALTEDGKDKAAQALGRKGRRARAALSSRKRKAIAQKAAQARWKKGNS